MRLSTVLVWVRLRREGDWLITTLSMQPLSGGSGRLDLEQEVAVMAAAVRNRRIFFIKEVCRLTGRAGKTLYCTGIVMET